MKLTEQTEALCIDRMSHFEDALLRGKPLRPRRQQWTLGDLIFLEALLKQMTGNLGEFSEAEFSTPLAEIFVVA
jgi:hypothetical protein